MKKKKQHFEAEHHTLSGYASVDLHEDFVKFTSAFIDFDPARFEPVALKLFIQNAQPILTLFALDRQKEGKATSGKKSPVKKFKLRIDWGEWLKQVKAFDFVVSKQPFDMDEMVVTNK